MITVLYVDDESTHLNVGKTFLEKTEGITVDTVSSAKKALALEKFPQYDAIVSDYEMPAMDGIEFLKQIRGSGNTVPFILFTGKGREEVAIQALHEGADFYIKKGGDPGSLYTELAHMIRIAVQQRRDKLAVPAGERGRIGCQTAGRDITEYGLAGVALRESEELFRNIYRESPIAIELFNRDGILTDVNPACCILFGFDSPDAVKGFRLFCDPNIPPGERELLRSGKAVHFETDFDFGLVRKNNLYRTKREGKIRLDIRINPLRNDAGVVSGFLVQILEITDQRRALEALKENERNYREIFNSTSESIMIDDAATGKIIDVNATTLAMYGYDSKEELLAGNIGSLSANIPPYDEAEAQAGIRKCVTEGPQVFEWLAKKKNGEQFWTEVSLRKSEIGGKGKILAVVRDITTRKMAEGALRESEEKYRLLADSARDFIYIIDKDDNVTYVNRSGLAILKKSIGEVVGKPRRDLFPGDIADRQYTGLRQVFDSGMPFHNEGTIPMPGGVTWQDTYLVPLRSEDGTINAVMGLSRDITGRKKEEEELRESRQILEAVLNTIPARVFWKDTNLTYLGCNTAFARDAGFEKTEDVIGRDDYAMGWRNQAELYRADDRQVIESGRAKLLIEEPQTTPSGGQIFLLTSKVPLRDETGTIIGVLGTYLDITERKKAEVALRHVNKKLNLLTGITRHDIKNQLLSLNAYLVLSRGTLNDVQKTREFIQIEEGITKTIEHQILFTREYENLGANAPVWQNVQECIGNAAQELDITGVDVITREMRPVEIFADSLLQKVFFNLIDNSLRHGGGAMTQIRFSYLDTGKELLIFCEDDGSGIPADEKEMVFERGYGKNTGFGLFFIREILAITGITITENGEPGTGTRFAIAVPKGEYRFAI